MGGFGSYDPSTGGTGTSSGGSTGNPYPPGSLLAAQWDAQHPTASKSVYVFNDGDVGYQQGGVLYHSDGSVATSDPYVSHATGGGSTTIVNASTGGAHYTLMYGPEGYGTYETSSGVPILVGLKADPNAPKTDPRDPNGDGYNDSTGLPLDVIRDSNSPTGYLHFGVPVNADGSLYTGGGTGAGPQYTQQVDKDGSITGTPGATYQKDTKTGAITVIFRPSASSSGSTTYSSSNNAGGTSGAAQVAAASINAASDKVIAAMHSQDLAAQLAAQKELAQAARDGQMALQKQAQSFTGGQNALDRAQQQAQFLANLKLNVNQQKLALATGFMAAVQSVDPQGFTAFLTGLNGLGLTNGDSLDTISNSLHSGRTALTDKALLSGAMMLDARNELDNIVNAASQPVAGSGSALPSAGTDGSGTPAPPRTASGRLIDGGGYRASRPLGIQAPHDQVPGTGLGGYVNPNVAMGAAYGAYAGMGGGTPDQVGAMFNYGAPGTQGGYSGGEGQYNFNDATAKALYESGTHPELFSPQDIAAHPDWVAPGSAPVPTGMPPGGQAYADAVGAKTDPATGQAVIDPATGLTVPKPLDKQAVVPLAHGGMTTARTLMAGDPQRPGQVNPEIIDNPTGAPLSVTPVNRLGIGGSGMFSQPRPAPRQLGIGANTQFPTNPAAGDIPIGDIQHNPPLIDGGMPQTHNPYVNTGMAKFGQLGLNPQPRPVPPVGGMRRPISPFLMRYLQRGAGITPGFQDLQALARRRPGWGIQPPQGQQTDFIPGPQMFAHIPRFAFGTGDRYSALTSYLAASRPLLAQRLGIQPSGTSGTGTAPAPSQPPPVPIPPPAPGGIPADTATQSSIDAVRNLRQGTDVPDFNLIYGTDWNQLDPTYRATTEAGWQTKYGIPVGSTEFEQQKRALQGFGTGSLAVGY